jgi:hypothetical protein
MEERIDELEDRTIQFKKHKEICLRGLVLVGRGSGEEVNMMQKMCTYVCKCSNDTC